MVSNLPMGFKFRIMVFRLYFNLCIRSCLRGLWLGLKSARCDFNQATFWFCWGTEFDHHQVYNLEQACDILKHHEFNKNIRTTLYIHGYVESPYVESIHVIVNAYLKRADQNIIILDWSSLAEGNYIFDAVQNAKQLGPKVAEELIKMFNNGLDIDLFHLVGHSLGGQLSGMVGRSIKKQSKKELVLRRISALDPAFPPFYPGETHISEKDALFVDVIHTDAWLYGAPISTGSVDFWPNGGKTLQPGCPKRNYKMLSDNDLCSHRRSWRFWADSVANKNTSTFHAVRAKSWSDFKKGRTDDSLIIQMGIDCVADARGDFYLQTNAELPFSRGMAGITYEKLDKAPIKPELAVQRTAAEGEAENIADDSVVLSHKTRELQLMSPVAVGSGKE